MTRALARELIVFDGHLLWEAAGTPGRVLTAEGGFGYPKRKILVDQIGDPYINLFRKTISKQREYFIELDLSAPSNMSINQMRGLWEEWNAPGDERVLRRVTNNGGVFLLDAVPGDPEWSGETLTKVHVRQPYTAVNPWWYGPAQAGSGVFNGITPVSIAVDNTGNIPSWLSILVEGAVEDPQIAVDGGYFIGLDYTCGAGESLEILCKPPAEIYHIVGSVETSIFGFRTSGSWLNRVAIPSGPSNVVISAASGSADCSISWRPMYGVRI